MLDSIKLKTESSIISAKVFAQMFCEVPQDTFELKMKYDLFNCRRQHLMLDHLLNTKLPVGNNKKKNKPRQTKKNLNGGIILNKLIILKTYSCL